MHFVDGVTCTISSLKINPNLNLFRYRDGAGNAYGGGVHDSSLKQNALGNQGQYGGAGGYRTTDNRGGVVGGVDGYGGGVRQGSVGSGGVIQPIVSRPIYVQQPVHVAQPVHIAQPLPIAPQPVPVAPQPVQAVALPPIPIPAAQSVSTPYVVPTPNKLYYDRPNVVVTSAG